MYSKIYRIARTAWPGGLETRRNRKELEVTQWLSTSDLEALQFKRIRDLLAYAYKNVLYYQKKFNEHGIHPEDIQSIDHIQSLPFLTRDDVNRNLDDLLSPSFVGKVTMDSTGGSTGQPMRFYVEDSFWWWNAALEFRGRDWFGVKEGDRIAWIWGAAQEIADWNWKKNLKARILNGRYLNSFSMTEKKMQDFSDLLLKWKPDMFRAYGSAITLYARFLREKGITGIAPRIIETTAEKLTDQQREILEDTFNCQVVDCYTARELATIAYQCENGRMHVCENRYLEIISNDEPVPSGQMGEIVITSLNQFGMPFIRYKNGDMGIMDDQPCPCGRGMPVIKELIGRITDYIVSSDGHYIHGGVFPRTFRRREEILRYQVYQPDKKHIEIKLECKKDSDPAFITDVKNTLAEFLGSSMQISINIVDEIELTPAGKHRPIISDVKPDFVD